MSRWVAAAGALVVSLDSMMNIAFRAIAAAFAVPPERVRWVIICYVLTYAISAFAGGAAADQIGHVAVFRAGVALSVVAFVMGGVAPTFSWLLIARIVQGLAGGLIYGTAPALTPLGAPAAAGAAFGGAGGGWASWARCPPARSSNRPAGAPSPTSACRWRWQCSSGRCSHAPSPSSESASRCPSAT